MNNRMYEICGNCGRRYGLHINQHCYAYFNSVFKSTGKYEGENMNNKIQMTEEQAREFIKPIFLNYSFYESNMESAINELKESGHIIKSELQQKVEEAERMYFKIQSEREFNDLEVVLIRAFRELKQSHPEFKK